MVDLRGFRAGRGEVGEQRRRRGTEREGLLVGKLRALLLERCCCRPDEALMTPSLTDSHSLPPQNNGRNAHQEVDVRPLSFQCNSSKLISSTTQHVHFHSPSFTPDPCVPLTPSLPPVIPKPSVSDEEGLVIGWPTKPADMGELKKYLEEIKGRL